MKKTKEKALAVIFFGRNSAEGNKWWDTLPRKVGHPYSFVLFYHRKDLI
ncbi:hypothetical protein [Enterococcus sp. N249-2]